MKGLSFLLVVAALLPSFVSSAWGQERPSGLALADGIRQVEEGDLEAAIFTLDSVVQELATKPRNERNLALAHLYLGMAHLGLSQLDRAREEMRHAWQSDHTLKLDANRFPPRVIQLYSETVAAVEGPEAPPTLAGKTGHTKAPIIGIGAVAAASVVGALTLAGSSKSPRSTVNGSTPFLPDSLTGQWDGLADPATGTRQDLVLQQTANSVLGYVMIEDFKHGVTGPSVGAIQGVLSVPASGPPSITFDLVRSDINLTLRGIGTFDATLKIMSGHWISGDSWVFTKD
jgi:hypothetical protein